MSGNPLHGPRKPGMWLPPMRWPASIDGHPREQVPAGRCVDCSPLAHPKDAVTTVAYGGRHACLLHARLRAGVSDDTQKGERPTP